MITGNTSLGRAQRGHGLAGLDARMGSGLSSAWKRAGEATRSLMALALHPQARVYAALARFTRAFVEVETQGFDLIE